MEVVNFPYSPSGDASVRKKDVNLFRWSRFSKRLCIKVLSGLRASWIITHPKWCWNDRNPSVVCRYQLQMLNQITCFIVSWIPLKKMIQVGNSENKKHRPTWIRRRHSIAVLATTVIAALGTLDGTNIEAQTPPGDVRSNPRNLRTNIQEQQKDLWFFGRAIYFECLLCLHPVPEETYAWVVKW